MFDYVNFLGQQMRFQQLRKEVAQDRLADLALAGQAKPVSLARRARAVVGHELVELGREIESLGGRLQRSRRESAECCSAEPGGV